MVSGTFVIKSISQVLDCSLTTLIFRKTIKEEILNLLEEKLDSELWDAWQDDGRCCVPILLAVFAEVS